MDTFYANFNVLDWIIFAIFIFSVLSGLSKGFLREVCLLFVWLIAGILTYFFSDYVSEKAFYWISDPRLSLLISSAAILFGAWVVGRILAIVLTSNRSVTFSSRIGGMFVSVFKTFLLIALIVNVANLSDEISTSSIWQNSYFVNKVMDATFWFDHSDKKDQKVPYKSNPDSSQTKSSPDSNQTKSSKAIGHSGPMKYPKSN